MEKPVFDDERSYERSYNDNTTCDDVSYNTSSYNTTYEEYEIDPDYENYLQNSFQDEIVMSIFNDVAEYIKDQAIPICEHLTLEDIEIIIENI
jgi:hypothetical protein